MKASFKILLSFIFLFLNSVVTKPVPRLSSQTEWRALLDLRGSLGIKAKYWHRKANPCLNWTGIECKNGHMIGINLSGLRRTPQGKLNPWFAVDSLPKFSFLSSFNSSGFLLRGFIPEWFGQRLTNLEVLDLRSSSIYGSIPTSVGSLSRLSSLYLSNNSITGSMPSTLGKLSSLSVLDLSQNLLTGQIPSEISSLENLVMLDLSSNYLSGGITFDLSSFSSLKLLNLSNNSLSATIPAQLGNLSQLRELDLGSNSFFGSLPGQLGGLRSLRKMLVGNNELEGSLSDGLFQKLTQLEYLVLSGNKFPGRLPDALWSMPHLEYLDVSGNELNGTLPNLTSLNVIGSIFNLSNNRFYGNLSPGIGKFHILDISSNYLQGSVPNRTRTRIILSNNCFSEVADQRNSEVCTKFYSDKSRGRGKKSLEPTSAKRPNSRKRFVYIMVGVFGGVGFMIILILGTLLFVKSSNVGSKNHQTEIRNVGPVIEGDTEQPSNVVIDFSSPGEAFTYEQMLLATCNFSTENLIKRGHSGDLFRGTLEGGRNVVVKRVDLRFIRNESFMLELEWLGKVAHPRLVPLVGHCLEDEHEKFLVYKYMPNGDLSNVLYRLTNPEEELQSLDWITRLKIATGAAEALSYLHHECTPPVVHRDIQASSILLDDKYEVRLASFSEACAVGANNQQNMIQRLLPVPQTSGKRPSGSSSITCADDVYCFGKVLLELVTGTLGISRLNDAEVKQWLESNLPFISVLEKELMSKIVDQSLIIDEDLLEEVWAVAIVAKSCLNPKSSRRPSMKHVLRALENPFKVVRGENFSSERLRTASSGNPWTAAFFRSWQHSSSDSSDKSGQTNREVSGGFRQSESRGSRANDHSSSQKRSSSDVFPEPLEMRDAEG